MAFPSSGGRWGVYDVTALIGEGGMGQVYQATDTKLNRQVALKILPEAFATDPDRLARFQREAQVLASLNHPNIGHIYGLEESDDTRALVLELVEGPTLADRIAQGPIFIDEALPVAKQIAEALEAAHEAGVIHRDLKPANIKVRDDGTVKVLDFGLAKALDTAPQGDPFQSPTLTVATTQLGVIMGTAAYMSPEQARGKPVDRRADIWSFGVVLFEMLSGRHPFEGRDASEVLAGVIRTEPAWDVVADAPPHLNMLLKRCLEKEPRQRIQAAGDVRLALEGAFETDASQAVKSVAVPRPAAWRRALPLALASLVSAVVVGVTTWSLVPPEPRSVSRFDYQLPEGLNFRGVERKVVAVSPNGEHFVYNGTDGLYIRSIDEFDARLIPGTEAPLTNPVFSPNGQDLAYGTTTGIAKISVSGGAPISLTPPLPVDNLGMSWERDGTIVYGQPDGIWQVSENGGTPIQLIATGPGEQASQPQLLPGGEWVLFTLASLESALRGNRWDEADIVIESLVSRERRVLRPGGSDGRYVPTGHLVYVFEDGLFALPFDVESLETSGGPVSIIRGVGQGARTGSGHYSFSDDGTLVYVPPGGAASQDRTLALVDHQGAAEPLNVPPHQYLNPRISPDGSRLVVQTAGQEDSDLWIYDLSGETQIRQLTRGGINRIPIWTPDGDRVTYVSDQDGADSIYWRLADGSGVPERLTTSEDETGQNPMSWSPDGSVLAFARTAVADAAIWTLSLNSGAEPELFYDIPDGSDQRGAAFSPNGRWLVFHSDEGGEAEGQIYVLPFPAIGVEPPADHTGWWCIPGVVAGEPMNCSTDAPFSMLQSLMSVDVISEAPFAVGPERELPIRFLVGNRRNYDITPDGEHFLMVVPEDQRDAGTAEGPQINVVLNWFKELKDRVPVT